MYVHTANGLHYADWIRNYEQGHSFATNGPIVSIDVNGKGPGEELSLAAGPQTVKVTAKLRTHIPLDHFAIVVNGIVVASDRLIERGEKTLTAEVPLTGSAWIGARAMGPRHRLVLNDTGAFAHTSPVYITVGGKRLVVKEDARYFIEWIERLKQNTVRRGRFSTPQRQKEVLDLFEKAAAVYRAL